MSSERMSREGGMSALPHQWHECHTFALRSIIDTALDSPHACDKRKAGVCFEGFRTLRPSV